ncbi:hypothetical protein J7E93_34625, partial [Streptomyces sp. ISL-36]|nr:hypothetical protein [Streptomyces sp. ISL-36]
MIEGLLPEDPAAIGPYRLLARWPGPRQGLSDASMFLGRGRDHTHTVICLLPPAAYQAAAVLRRSPVPGVPAVLDLRTGTDLSWVSLAHTPAVALSDVTRPAPAAELLSLGQAVRLTGAVAGTLAGLHALGVSYGAVAPDGVWLTTGGPLLLALHACRTPRGTAVSRGGRPGRAARSGVLETDGRVSMVAPSFMAPEVAVGGPPSAAADVYALAVLMIHTATGRLPFGEGPPPVLAYRAAHGRPELHGLNGELGEAVAAALAPAPADRPTAAELSRAAARWEG